MALTADRLDARRQGGHADHRRLRHRIDTDDDAASPSARRVTWRIGATGEQVTEEAQVIVMAGGCIETPRLWLNRGLPNPNDWVGRGLTDHHFDTSSGDAVRDAAPSKGPGSRRAPTSPAGAAREHRGRTGAAGVFGDLQRRRNRRASTTTAGPTARRRRNVGRLVGSGTARLHVHGRQAAEHPRPHRRRRGGAKPGHAVHEPAPRRARPRPTGGDTTSATVPRRTKRNREYLASKAVRAAAGRRGEQVYRINFPPSLFHSHSTMRMGLTRPIRSATRTPRRAAVKRLFIADNSALANCLGGPNPTLTTQALATRTAEKIFQLYFGGEPWVGRRRPSPRSTPAVTQAVMSRRLE